jgi:hypothetical protein
VTHFVLDPCWNNGQCDPRSKCSLVENEPAGFNCPCYGDLIGDGRWNIGCSCPPGYGLSEDDDTVCVNLNECKLEIDECDEQKGIFSYCVDTIGKRCLSPNTFYRGVTHSSMIFGFSFLLEISCVY